MSFRLSHASFLLTLLLCSVTLGCQSEPAYRVKVVPDQVPPGWTAAQSPDGKVRIGVAPGWRYGADRMMDMGGVDLSGMQGQDPQASDALQQMTQGMQADADKAEAEELERLAKKGTIIQVISTGNKPIIGEARTRYYVHRTTHDGPISLVEAAEIERKHYPFKPTYETIQLPIGEAIRTYQKNELRDGGVRHEISYVVVNGNDMYSLRFVTQESPDTIQSIAEQVAQTLRITP